jgi:predicted GH43/DUF377 family glycosyl hydrolase
LWYGGEQIGHASDEKRFGGGTDPVRIREGFLERYRVTRENDTVRIDKKVGA